MFTECVFLLIDGDNMPKQVASCGAVPLEYTNNTVMSWSVFPPAEDFRKSWVRNPILSILTLPETNIAPKNGWLEYYFPIEEAYFQGLC